MLLYNKYVNGYTKYTMNYKYLYIYIHIYIIINYIKKNEYFSTIFMKPFVEYLVTYDLVTEDKTNDNDGGYWCETLTK